MEYWRVCSRLPDYIISSEGRVMHIPRQVKMHRGGLEWVGGLITTGVKNPDGRIQLQYRGKTHKLHQLVCETFHGPKPFPGAVVMHLNDDPSDNRAANLKWGTQKENLNTPRFLEYCRNRTGENNPVLKGRAKKAAA